jgi:predicted ATPase with chaperone activity
VGSSEVREYCPLDDAGKSLLLAPRSVGLRDAMTQTCLSARGFHRIVKLVRTIADL